MKTTILAAGAAVLLVSAWAGADERSALREIGEGRALYLVNCASCHGADVRGGKAPDLTSMGKGFDRRHVANRIEGRRDGLHGTRCPAWGTLLEHTWPQGRGPATLKIHKLTRYLESVQAGGSPMQAAK